MQWVSELYDHFTSGDVKFFIVIYDFDRGLTLLEEVENDASDFVFGGLKSLKFRGRVAKWYGRPTASNMIVSSALRARWVRCSVAVYSDWLWLLCELGQTRLSEKNLHGKGTRMLVNVIK